MLNSSSTILDMLSNTFRFGIHLWSKAVELVIVKSYPLLRYHSVAGHLGLGHKVPGADPEAHGNLFPGNVNALD